MVEGEGVTNTLAPFMEGPLATLRAHERVSEKCIMQENGSGERSTSRKEPSCCGLSIWKLTKILVLAKITREARLGFKRTKGAGAYMAGQQDPRARDAFRVTGTESSCGLERFPGVYSCRDLAC